MDRVLFGAAALLGLAAASAVTLGATEPMGSAGMASAPATVSTPVPAPSAPEEASDAGTEGPALVGFEDAGALGEVPQLSMSAPLPSTAPSGSVHFGLALVRYDGAQGAASGARSKADALQLATRLAEQGRADFHAAVAGADGGGDDMGTLKLSTLEAPTAAAMAQLEVGAVSDPIDTPTGFWVVKRLP